MADMNDRELKSALQQIEKQFGKGAIMQLGENALLDIEGISTGALIIAKGPALCSPLNGVNLVGSSAGKPQAAASCGLLNQNPR